MGRQTERRHVMTAPASAEAPVDQERYLHLTPAEVWERQRSGGEYRPEAFERDGFIHCTIGHERLVWVGNQFYGGDSRDHVVLVIDPARLMAPVRFEDPENVFPHLYGPLNVEAVDTVLRIGRREDGTFIGVERGPNGR
jgi:uncharacterized protein (DUF952 family)